MMGDRMGQGEAAISTAIILLSLWAMGSMVQDIRSRADSLAARTQATLAQARCE